MVGQVVLRQDANYIARMCIAVADDQAAVSVKRLADSDSWRSDASVLFCGASPAMGPGRLGCRSAECDAIAAFCLGVIKGFVRPVQQSIWGHL